MLKSPKIFKIYQKRASTSQKLMNSKYTSMLEINHLVCQNYPPVFTSTYPVSLLEFTSNYTVINFRATKAGAP